MKTVKTDDFMKLNVKSATIVDDFDNLKDELVQRDEKFYELI
jgi:hypothetical protein